ncbi:MAG TPA: DUF6804 family protein [Terriglobales bacterium]|nr:DUF6804 family protein [Terriglobales bacterium]
MLAKILKWAAIAVLIGGLFWRPLGGYGILLQFVVSAAAMVVLVQAAGMRQYVWMSLFLLVAGLFNPVLPIGFSKSIFMVVSTLTLVLFFFSLEHLQPKPRLSIASITDRMPGSESL